MPRRTSWTTGRLPGLKANHARDKFANMVLEFWCNWFTLFEVGPVIMSTYGIPSGFAGASFHVATMYFLHAFELSGVPSVKANELAPMCGVASVAAMLGSRMCSMYLEDSHNIAAGHYLQAFLRPGWLEAGSANGPIWILLPLFVHMYPVTFVPMFLTFWDAFIVSYYLFMFFIKIGCVAYGCCWGFVLEKPAWYATYYNNPRAKVLRMRPDLKNIPLFPCSSLMSLVFLKNSLICLGVLRVLPYRPGLFGAFVPLINMGDKKVYFPWRGDSGGGEEGIDTTEDFRMVGHIEKKAYCTRWATPAKYLMYFTWCYVLFSWTTTSSVWINMYDRKVFDAFVQTPQFARDTVLSFVLWGFAFSFMYQVPGRWVPRLSTTTKSD